MRPTLKDTAEAIVGDIRYGRDIGLNNSSNKYQWIACQDCGKERWVGLVFGDPRSPRCVSCASLQRAKYLCDPRIDTSTLKIQNKTRGTSRYAWMACPQCKQGRWVQPKSLCRSEYTGLCSHCYNSRKGMARSNWNGGRISHQGYIKVKIYPDDFFFAMAGNQNYIWEHRLVMAKHLGRCLHDW